MNRLQFHCNRFVRKTSAVTQDGLELLLKDAFMGDHGSWLVFLDFLEEQSPSTAEEIRSTVLGEFKLLEFFKVINKFFPQFVSIDRRDITITVPNIFNFKKIYRGGFAPFEFVYPTFSLYYTGAKNFTISFKGTDAYHTPIIIDNYKVYYISERDNDSFRVNIETVGGLINQEDSIYSDVAEACRDHKAEYEADLNKLKSIFELK